MERLPVVPAQLGSLGKKTRKGRPFREDFTTISALPLQCKAQARAVVDGPVRVGLMLWPKTCLVSWWWHRRHYWVLVRRTKTKNNRLWWVCPKCGRTTHTVLVGPPEGGGAVYGCCRCLQPVYSHWYAPRPRPRKTPEAWLKQEAARWKRIARQAAKGGLDDAGENAEINLERLDASTQAGDPNS